MKHTMVFSFANHKGGVGKTTNTINLGAALAYAGKSVVLIDADPQMNSSIHMLPDLVKNSDSVTLSMLLFNPSVDIWDAIHPTSIENLHMIIADRGIEDLLEANKGRWMKPFELLSEKIALLDGEVDFIIIDCPPNLGLAVENALVASTHFIVPIDDSSYSELGIIPLEDKMLKKVFQVNKKLSCLGVLPVMMRKGTALESNIGEKTTFGSLNLPKLPISIPFRQQVANNTHTGDLVATKPARTEIAKAYKALAAYVIDNKELWLQQSKTAEEGVA
jgi:chromosome partitioning protein